MQMRLVTAVMIAAAFFNGLIIGMYFGSGPGQPAEYRQKERTATSAAAEGAEARDRQRGVLRRDREEQMRNRLRDLEEEMRRTTEDREQGLEMEPEPGG